MDMLLACMHEEEPLNQHVNPSELPLTRDAKLLRIARIARAATHPIFIHSGLEDMVPEQLSCVAILHPSHGINGLSIFALARRDKAFRADGLSPEANTFQVIEYLGLEPAELYAFTNEEAGPMSGRLLAERIESLL